MHVLAYCYHWGLSEIKDLSTSERRMWCEMVRKQKEAEAKALSNKPSEDTGYHSSYSESY